MGGKMFHTKRKNVIVIMADDQGYWTLGCAGNPNAHTPNIDKLAETGVRFDDFFCVSPVCSPARASFFTGNIPSAHGVTDWLAGGNLDARQYEETRTPMYANERECIDFLDGNMTFTEILQQNGYICALAGKWHLGDSVHMQHGFTKWFSVPLGHSEYINPTVIENGEVVTKKGFITDMITEQAVGYIKELGEAYNTKNMPFYISVHYTAPHGLWGKKCQPSEWFEYYKDCTFDEVPFEPMHPNSIFTNESPYFAYSTIATEPEEVRKELLSGYYGAIASLDRGVGRILEELDVQNLIDDTVIVFTSDNGMSTGHHGVWGKGNGTYPQNMYDTAVKVPFIVRGNGMAENVVCDGLYSQYDFFPTLVEMLGLKLTNQQKNALEQLPGKSFYKVIKTGVEDSKEEKAVVVYSEYGPVRMIRTKDWKYIHYYPFGENELYHISRDPQEHHNLIKEPEQQERIRKMKWELDNWFVQYVDPRKDATKDNNTGNGQLYKNGCDTGGRQAFINSDTIGMPYMEAIDFMKKR